MDNLLHDPILTGPTLKMGFPRSGNLWLTTVLHKVFHHTGQYKCYLRSIPEFYAAQKFVRKSEQFVYDEIKMVDGRCFFLIFDSPGRIFLFEISDMGDFLSKTSLVWTHSRLSDQSYPYFSQFRKVLYILRDPRAAIDSLSYWESRPALRHTRGKQKELFEINLKNWVSDWCNHVASALAYRSQLDMHFVFYERLRANFDEELTAILRFLDIDLSSTIRDRIREDTSYDEMKKEDIHNHMRGGRTKSWQETWSKRNLSYVSNVAGPLLEVLAYPGRNLSAVSRLPSLPTDIPQKQVEEILRRIRRKDLGRDCYSQGVSTLKRLKELVLSYS
jgi:hypothetical protein